MSVQILHGLSLLPEKPQKTAPKPRATWSYGAQLTPDMATAVDRLAARAGVTVSDVIRTAISRLLELTEPVDSITDPAAPQTIAAPRQAPPYRGNGKSDHAGLMALNGRQEQRKARAQGGERLVDKATVR